MGREPNCLTLKTDPVATAPGTDLMTNGPTESVPGAIATGTALSKKKAQPLSKLRPELLLATAALPQRSGC